MFGLGLVVACGTFIQLSSALVLLAMNGYTVPLFLHLLLKSLCFFMICAMLKTAPLFSGFVALFDMKNSTRSAPRFWFGQLGCIAV